MADSTKLGELDTDKILKRSGESSFDTVYDVDLLGFGVIKMCSFDKFQGLRTLNLGCNAITVIEGLESNKELRELKLHSNSITSVTGLKDLKQLTRLCLQHNQIKDIGTELQGLKQLIDVRLDFNKLQTLTGLPVSLQSLDVSSNALSSLKGLENLTSLKELKAANNSLTDASSLSRCKKLEELDFNDNKLSNLASIKNFPYLKVLYLNRNGLTSLDSLGRINTLAELYLSGNQIKSVKGLESIAPNLEILDVSSNQLENIGELSTTLAGMQEISELSVKGNPFVKGTDQEKQALLLQIINKVLTLETLDGNMIVRDTESGVALRRPGTASGVRPSTADARGRPKSAAGQAAGSGGGGMSGDAVKTIPLVSSRTFEARQLAEQIDSSERDLLQKQQHLHMQFTMLKDKLRSISTKKNDDFPL